MENAELDRFVGEIVSAKALPGVTDEVRTQLVSDLKERLLDQIDRALIDALPDDKADELNTMLDDPSIDDAALQSFIASSGVDVRGVTIATMLRFRDLYLNSRGKEA